MSNVTGILLVIGLLVVLAVPSLRRLGEAYRLRRRETVEDALKVLIDLGAQRPDRVADILAGRLHLSRRAALRLIQMLNERGLVSMEGDLMRLTSLGRALGLHIVRAHRLWECYLSDDAAVPLKEVHRLAEKAEHHLSPHDVRRLEARMGYPRYDPHGDPIPQADDKTVDCPGTPLSVWPEGEPACIVHVEDEPESVFAHILAEGLTPGTQVVVLERSPQGMRVQADGNDVWLTTVMASHIHVAAAPEGLPGTGHITLADVPEGMQVQVVGISPEVRGLLRRRLLDLGFTRGAVVEPVLRSSFGRGDPTAYRVRGTLIALRREQARHIWVEPLDHTSQEEHDEQTGETARAYPVDA